MLQIVTLVLPLFGLIGLGYLAGHKQIAKKEWIGVLNLFGYYIAFPALILKSLAFAPISLQLHGTILVTQIIFGAVMLGGVYFITKKIGLSVQDRNTYTIALYFSQSGYIGIEALRLVYGQTAAAEGAVIVGGMILVTLTLGIALLELSKYKKVRTKLIAKHILMNPLIWATVVGGAIGLWQIQLPDVLTQLINILGASASPTVLVALGIFMAYYHPKRHALMQASQIAGIKLLLIPAVMAVVVWWLPNSQWLQTTFIQISTPVAITAFAFAEIYPMNKAVVSSAILLSTLLSFVVLPLAMWLAPLL